MQNPSFSSLFRAKYKVVYVKQPVSVKDQLFKPRTLGAVQIITGSIS